MCHSFLLGRSECHHIIGVFSLIFAAEALGVGKRPVAAEHVTVRAFCGAAHVFHGACGFHLLGCGLHIAGYGGAVELQRHLVTVNGRCLNVSHHGKVVVAFHQGGVAAYSYCRAVHCAFAHKV